MHIKKLEIAGFKSFVDRTAIHFDHDVVGIVGPNGCGKSNIVDAIRWCLGEQSAKHLRGRAMEDVILNGSESAAARPGRSHITFDNTNPEYPRPCPPSTASTRTSPSPAAFPRRHAKPGQQDQVRCATSPSSSSAPASHQAYSIVEQGRTARSSRPRKIDVSHREAAVSPIKQRRKMAERKMDLTRQNLLRVNDIVSEIDRNRASLKRQVAKAERFLDYRRELEDLVLLEASLKLLELTVTERVAAEGHEITSRAVADARTVLRDAESSLDTERAQAAAIEAATDEASRSAFEADNEVSSLQAELEKARERLTYLEHRLMGGDLELRSILEKNAQLTSEQEQVETRVSELSSDERAREADALQETEALSSLQSEDSKAAGLVLELRKDCGRAENARGCTRRAFGRLGATSGGSSHPA